MVTEDSADLPNLRPKTKAFVDRIIENPKISHTQAYLDTHTTENRAAAAVEAHKTLSKPNVQVYMRKHVKRAKETIVSIMVDTEVKASDRLRAAQDVLDRSVGKAVQRTESETKNINLNIEASVELGNDFAEYLRSKTQQSL